MKLGLLALFISFSSFADHQYIQCSSTNLDTTDMAVVSLSEGHNTLFMTSGLGNPDEIRVLKEIRFDSEDQDFVVYKSENETSRERVVLPVEIVGKKSDYFLINLELTNLSNNDQVVQEFSCYSRLYINE